MPKIVNSTAAAVPATGSPGSGSPAAGPLYQREDRPGLSRLFGPLFYLALAGGLIWLGFSGLASTVLSSLLLGGGAFLSILALGYLVYLYFMAAERVKQSRITTSEQMLFYERTQAEVEKAKAEADKARAEADQAHALTAKVRRESEVMSIIAPADHQVYISDLNHLAWWHARHSDQRFYSNSRDTYQSPGPEEWAAFQARHAKALPAATSLFPGAASLPEFIDLFELLGSSSPSLHRLIFGVALDSQGQRQLITGDLSNLYHIAVGGSSGWGKSGFLRQLVYQVMLAQERPSLLLVDLERNALAPFAGSPRLLLPLASDEPSAYRVFSFLHQEMTRRLKLFDEFGADDLAAYNGLEQVQPLPMIVCGVDEFNDLMELGSLRPLIQRVARHSRKTGIRLVLAAQEWTLKHVDEMTRRQLSTRLQFYATDSAQARQLVGKSMAGLLKAIKGRAVALIPGRETVLLQSPFLAREVIIQAIPGNMPGSSRGGFARGVQPETDWKSRLSFLLEDDEPGADTGEPAPGDLVLDDTLLDDALDVANEEKILRLWDDGASRGQISKAVWGYRSSNRYPDIESVLLAHGRVDKHGRPLTPRATPVSGELAPDEPTPDKVISDEAPSVTA